MVNNWTTWRVMNKKKTTHEKSQQQSKILRALKFHSNVNAQEKWIKQKSINTNRTDCTRCRIVIVIAVCLCFTLSSLCQMKKGTILCWWFVRALTLRRSDYGFKFAFSAWLYSIGKNRSTNRKKAKKNNSFVRCFFASSLCLAPMYVSLNTFII